MAIPTVRWRTTGYLNLHDDDALLRFFVDDINWVVKNAVNAAMSYGDVLRRTRHPNDSEVLVLSTYAPRTPGEQHELHAAWGTHRRIVGVPVGRLREQEIEIWPTATYLNDVPQPFSDIHFDVVVAVGAGLIPNGMGGTRTERRAARAELVRLFEPILDLFDIVVAT